MTRLPAIVRREELLTDAQLFGKRLRTARAAAGVNQGRLAKALDVDPKHVSRLERGRVKPSFDLVCKASKFLEISPSLLFDFESAADEPSVLKQQIRDLIESADSKHLQIIRRLLKALLEP